MGSLCRVHCIYVGKEVRLHVGKEDLVSLDLEQLLGHAFSHIELGNVNFLPEMLLLVGLLL